MPQAVDITLKDGAAAPVDHVFKPTRQSGDLFEFVDQSADVVAGFKKLTFSTRFESVKNQGRRVIIKITDPTLAVTSPASGTGVQPNPTAAYTPWFQGEFLIPQAANKAARANIYAFAKNALAHAFVQAQIVDLDAPR